MVLPQIFCDPGLKHQLCFSWHGIKTVAKREHVILLWKEKASYSILSVRFLTNFSRPQLVHEGLACAPSQGHSNASANPSLANPTPLSENFSPTLLQALPNSKTHLFWVRMLWTFSYALANPYQLGEGPLIPLLSYVNLNCYVQALFGLLPNAAPLLAVQVIDFVHNVAKLPNPGTTFNKRLCTALVAKNPVVEPLVGFCVSHAADNPVTGLQWASEYCRVFFHMLCATAAIPGAVVVMNPGWSAGR